MLGLAQVADLNFHAVFLMDWIIGLGPCRWSKWTGLISIYDPFKIVTMPATWLPYRIADVASLNCPWRYWIFITVMTVQIHHRRLWRFNSDRHVQSSTTPHFLRWFFHHKIVINQPLWWFSDEFWGSLVNTFLVVIAVARWLSSPPCASCLDLMSCPIWLRSLLCNSTYLVCWDPMNIGVMIELLYWNISYVISMLFMILHALQC
jgi:hypothetical protein